MDNRGTPKNCRRAYVQNRGTPKIAAKLMSKMRRSNEVYLGWYALKKQLDVTFVCCWGFASGLLLFYDAFGALTESWQSERAEIPASPIEMYIARKKPPLYANGFSGSGKYCVAAKAHDLSGLGLGPRHPAIVETKGRVSGNSYLKGMRKCQGFLQVSHSTQTALEARELVGPGHSKQTVKSQVEH